LRRDKSHENANEEVTMEASRNFLKGKAPQNDQKLEEKKKERNVAKLRGYKLKDKGIT